MLAPPYLVTDSELEVIVERLDTALGSAVG
jgi:hypothetical protein